MGHYSPPMTRTGAPRQLPLGSGFGPHTTAREVLAGVDLTGRTFVVTGEYAGLGLEVVRALHGAGAEVLAPARRPEEARRALCDVDAHLARIEVGQMDLADQDQVRAYAEAVVASGRRLDCVIGNAGIMACPEARTPQGWESQFATNHLGHFALVNRLWPALASGARVISVSSSGHHYTPIRWEDPWFETGYDKWLAYGQSKTANILFALGLTGRAAGHPQGRGITAFSLHPGAILTNLGRHLDDADIAELMEPDEHGQVAIPEFKSPEAGAATAVWAATSLLLEGRGGEFLADCDVAPWAPDPPPGPHRGDGVGVRDYALDPKQAERLWAWSAELTGVDALRA